MKIELRMKFNYRGPLGRFDTGRTHRVEEVVARQLPPEYVKSIEPVAEKAVIGSPADKQARPGKNNMKTK